MSSIKNQKHSLRQGLTHFDSQLGEIEADILSLVGNQRKIQ